MSKIPRAYVIATSGTATCFRLCPSVPPKAGLRFWCSDRGGRTEERILVVDTADPIKDLCEAFPDASIYLSIEDLKAIHRGRSVIVSARGYIAT